ncbi:MAG TPA: UDP-diphosphatase [Cytophagales bacterium]|nr:UDP-diphosphatase [Cytophagales bacterium]HRG09206.1 undecaprenyl-diphosphate phosphatase [Cyclobacteriaceae bacterium]
MSYFDAIILAIVEGLTEFLPVSSTGHMIIASSLLGIESDSFTKTFTVAIQLGAIASVLVLYWKRFFQNFNFYFKLLVAFIPAMVFGLLFNDQIDALLENVMVVAISLIFGGIVFLFIDKLFNQESESTEIITYSSAFIIGMFQVIAMIPGVSRSAATIIGGLTQKLNKKTAAEFSFFLAVPTMLAATGYKLLKFYLDGNTFGQEQITTLMIGNVVAFVVALLAIKSFISYLTKHGFKVFGYYRIILGSIILILYWFGIDLQIV